MENINMCAKSAKEPVVREKLVQLVGQSSKSKFLVYSIRTKINSFVVTGVQDQEIQMPEDILGLLNLLRVNYNEIYETLVEIDSIL